MSDREPVRRPSDIVGEICPSTAFTPGQNRRVPDAIFDDPLLARVYDPLDPDRRDLDVYAALVREVDGWSVLDVGCGTGTFACMLALGGTHVTAVDPAKASLDVARASPAPTPSRGSWATRRCFRRCASTLRS